MNYTTLILLLSLSTFTFCAKSNKSDDEASPLNDQSEINDEEDGKEDLILASFLYEKFKFSFDVNNNPEYLKQTGDKPLTFAFEEIGEEDDWKVVAKLNGNFLYSNGTNLPVHLDLLKFAAIGPDDAVEEDHKNDVIQLSTVEINSVKSPYRVFLTCNDCEEVLEAIGEANDGLHITEEIMTYDTIGASVNQNEDDSFTLSMVILLNNDYEGSEITSMINDDEEEVQSMSSEVDMDIDNSLQVFLKDKFAQNLKIAEKMDSEQSQIKKDQVHKILV